MSKSGSTRSAVALIMIGMLWACNQGDEATADKAAVDEASGTNALFRKIPSSQSGVSFENYVDERFENFFDFFPYVYNGGGVAVGDINNDGLPDLYFTGNEVPNKLYLNEGGFKFKDITAEAGVDGGAGWHNGVSMVDINGDGLLDIYVNRGGWQDADEDRSNLLFVNQGDLSFKEDAAAYGLDDRGYSIQTVFFDMDNDNDLDAYLINRPDSFYLPLSEMAALQQHSPDHSRHKLFENQDGKYVDVGRESGISNESGYGLNVLATDVNRDGFIDIFVSNDYSQGDYLYINRGDGTFKESVKEAMNHISLYSMGTDAADINNDGLEDIAVMEMRPEDYVRSKVSMPSMDVEGFHAIVDAGMHKQYMHNMLHLNQGNLFFSDISQYAGVSKTDWSWAVLAEDLDNDGFRDLFITNGMRRDLFDGDVQQRLKRYVENNRHKFHNPDDIFQKGFDDLIENYRPVKVKNYLFKNEGNLKFSKVSDEWGFADESFSHGAVTADLDNDGDLDLVVNNLEDEAFIYENTADHNYLEVVLNGPENNRHGLGAKVNIYYDGGQQYFENKVVRGYLSSTEPVAHFGLGQEEGVDSIVVSWNDGRENILTKVATNQSLKIAYQDAQRKTSREQPRNPLFAEATDKALAQPFEHRENEFNEFEEQVLLPHMFSKSGPFISKGDADGDGNVDFYVGGASGQPGELYLYKRGRFHAAQSGVFDADKDYEDIGSAFFDADGDGDLDLYVVSGGSQYKSGSEWYQDRLYINDGKGNFAKGELPITESSGSVVAPHDFDDDGDVDLFIGGQVVADRYPKSPRSYLLVNENGKFEDRTDQVNSALAEVGMVNSAEWTDLNGDSRSELVLAGEWMPVKIFGFQNGRFEDLSLSYGLANTEGWWNKLVAEDLDGDGDKDLIAGNIGENYKFSASTGKPFHVFAKDFDGNGTNDIFLAKYSQDELKPIRGRECSSQQMPSIAEKFPSFNAFAHADLEQILGKQMQNALHFKAYQFSNVIFVNEEGKFKAVKLPVEVQLSAVTGIVAEDFDRDGVKDLLIAGNKFDSEVETTPADASPGWFLKGKGDLEYEVLKPEESGFFVPYNVKDLKLVRNAGESYLLVGSNDDQLRVFEVKAAPRNEAERTISYNP